MHWEREHQRRTRLETREMRRGLWVTCGAFQVEVSNKKLSLRFRRVEELPELEGEILGMGRREVSVDYSERTEKKRRGRHSPPVTM